MKLFKNKKGITLVELLAVLVILGIIAAIAVPTVGGLIERARENAAVETGNGYVQAARLYSLERSSATQVAIGENLEVANRDADFEALGLFFEISSGSVEDLIDTDGNSVTQVAINSINVFWDSDAGRFDRIPD